MLVKDITTLSNALPQSIQQGMKDDKIWHVMNAGECDMGHETFNCRFDALFGEDCQDTSGRLLHIRRGKLGLGLVTSYLSKINWAHGFPLDIVKIKLQRLLTELKQLQHMANFTFLMNYVLTGVFLVVPKEIPLSKHDHHAKRLQPQS